MAYPVLLVQKGREKGMTDYTELIKALRICTEHRYCSSCDFTDKTRSFPCCSIGGQTGVMLKAAAAIEALQAEVEILKVSGREACFEGLAADAEPKHGEWIRKDAELYYWHECSKCGERPLYDRYANKVLSAYCPNCGAKMEVQDG